MEPIISVQNLVAHYGTRPVLQGVSMDVHRGQTMVILGGSGSGKSTLLRHIVGLETPTSGFVYIMGHDFCRLPERELNQIRRKMGMSFQGSAMFNSMTVGDNVALPLREHTELEESTIQIITRMKLEQVGLAGFENYMPSQLSGGMKKRAAVARAMAMDPEILLFDEPSAGLDPIIAAGIDELIVKLKQAFGMTIVVVTHELASAFLIADRITMVHKGRVIASGTREEIQGSTQPRVRQFLDRVPDDESLEASDYVQALLGTEGDAGRNGKTAESARPELQKRAGSAGSI
jgi:phospholipid/cholesterol/gamma-HCH transport system ATP-binding protein